MLGRALIVVGVLALAYAARPLPAFAMSRDDAEWWLRLVMGDPSQGMGFAIMAAWMFLEVPLLVPAGIVLVWWGVKEMRR